MNHQEDKTEDEDPGFSWGSPRFPRPFFRGYGTGPALKASDLTVLA